LIKKFFNEPVDALDLRLAKAEENFSALPRDPLTRIKKEVKDLSDNITIFLDYLIILIIREKKDCARCMRNIL